MKYKYNDIVLLLFAISLIILRDNINGQYVDGCEPDYNTSGFINAYGQITPQRCWKILPLIDSAYLVNDITVNLINASIPKGNVLHFIGGSNPLSKNPIITYYNGTYKEIGSPISTNKGVFIIFLDGANANINSSFTLHFTSSKEKQLKPAVVGLLSVAVAFAAPLIIFTIVKCLVPNSTSKQRYQQIKKTMFWVGFILGIMILVVLLSRRVI